MLAKSVMEMPGYTWRDVLRCEALLCIVGTLPLGLLFYRSRPELYGLLPDGRGSKSREYRQICIDSGPSKARGAADKSNNAAAVLRKKQALKTAEADARSWTAHDALRTTSLWATCGGVCLIACISMGVWFHLVGMVTDATEGHIVTSAQLSRVLGKAQTPLRLLLSATVWLRLCKTGVQTVGQMVAKFSFSWLLDRFSVRVVLLGAIVVQLLALGTFCLAIQLQLQLLALIAVGLQAAALGGAYSVDGVSYAKFFGRNSLGSITGATKACWQVATAIGPTPLGLVRDHTGTFVPALVGKTRAGNFCCWLQRAPDRLCARPQVLGVSVQWRLESSCCMQNAPPSQSRACCRASALKADTTCCRRKSQVKQIGMMTLSAESTVVTVTTSMVAGSGGRCWRKVPKRPCQMGPTASTKPMGRSYAVCTTHASGSHTRSCGYPRGS